MSLSHEVMTWLFNLLFFSEVIIFLLVQPVWVCTEDEERCRTLYSKLSHIQEVKSSKKFLQ